MREEMKDEYIYCNLEFSTRDPDKGFLLPVFLKEEFKPVSSPKDTFPNNGKIFVSRGYEKIENTVAVGEFVLAKVPFINFKYEEDPDDIRVAMYATMDSYIDRVEPFTICSIASGDYPDPANPSSFTAIVYDRAPVPGFFVRTKNNENNDVLIGPFDPVSGSSEPYGDGTRFLYKPIERPVKANWGPLMSAAQLAFEFEVALIPNDCFRNIERSEFLVETENLSFETARLIDFCGDEHLVRWASRSVRKITSKKLDSVQELGVELASVQGSLNVPADIVQGRIDRLHILSSADISAAGEVSKNNFNELFSGLLEGPDGKAAIESHVKANREQLIGSYLSDYIEIEKKKREGDLDKEIKLSKIAFNQQKSIWEKELQELEVSIESERQKALESELHNLDLKITERKEAMGLLDTVAELQSRSKFLDDHIRELDSKCDKAKTLLEETQSDISKTDETHKRRLLELKTDLDVLSGNIPETANAKHLADHKEMLSYEFTDIEQLRETLFTDVSQAISACEYNIGDEELLTTLVALTQNLITTISGAPGSGKSSLVSSIANAFGLNPNGNFVRVQTQRGWTTDKEILGFKNRLTNCYEKDIFGLHTLISELDKNPDEKWLGLVLLDEANLSPVEHYWANFFGATDSPETFTCEPSINGLSERLRFVATVNNDGTTEPLSSRFLDRSPVIRLDGDALDVASLSNTFCMKGVERQIDFDILQKAFGRLEDIELTSDETRILNELMEERKHGIITFSARNISSITNFVSSSREMFYALTGQRTSALDHAIKIFLLPSIQGQGRSYKKKLNELSVQFRELGMQRSERCVEDITSRSDFDMYSFFL